MNSETQTVTAGSDDQWHWIWEKRCAALHLAYVTYRYHRRRQRFFDLLDKGTKSATVLLGASLLGQSIKDHLPLVASAISGLGLFALVFGYSDRKQAHKELAEMAIKLAGDIERTVVGEITETAVGRWALEQSAINAKEPPPLKTLVIICEHEQALSVGQKDHVPQPNWMRRFVADFF
nr:hypothetical protein [Rhodoferax sp.]